MRIDAARRVLVGSGDPPDPDQAGFAGTVYTVLVCKEHDPDPSQSMPIQRPPGSVPVGGGVRGCARGTWSPRPTCASTATR